MIKSSKSSVPEVFNMNKKNYGLLGIEMDLRSLTNIFHICKKYTHLEAHLPYVFN